MLKSLLPILNNKCLYLWVVGLYFSLYIFLCDAGANVGLLHVPFTAVHLARQDDDARSRRDG